MSDPIGRIWEVFETRGNEKYADEDVTQQQHALQCALMAIEEGEPDELVVAALLHDIGHILGNEDLPTDCTKQLDDAHEDRGFEFLKAHFSDAVSEPVRLHVAAKRYLVTVDPDYRNKLTPTSLKSFHDQGGEMNTDEVKEFESNPHFEAAVRLRRWDDQAKKTDFAYVNVKDFAKKLENALALASPTTSSNLPT